jgi:hypothetical protein
MQLSTAGNRFFLQSRDKHDLMLRLSFCAYPRRQSLAGGGKTIQLVLESTLRRDAFLLN